MSLFREWVFLFFLWTLCGLIACIIVALLLLEVFIDVQSYVRRGRSVRRRGSALFSALGPLIANYIKIMSKLKRNSFDESKKGSIRSTVLNEGF